MNFYWRKNGYLIGWKASRYQTWFVRSVGCRLAAMNLAVARQAYSSCFAVFWAVAVSDIAEKA